MGSGRRQAAGPDIFGRTIETTTTPPRPFCCRSSKTPGTFWTSRVRADRGRTRARSGCGAFAQGSGGGARRAARASRNTTPRRRTTPTGSLVRRPSSSSCSSPRRVRAGILPARFLPRRRRRIFPPRSPISPISIRRRRRARLGHAHLPRRRMWRAAFSADGGSAQRQHRARSRPRGDASRRGAFPSSRARTPRGFDGASTSSGTARR